MSAPPATISTLSTCLMFSSTACAASPAAIPTSANVADHASEPSSDMGR
jgi:hypothetical protein